MNFIVSNRDNFPTNESIHNTNGRNKPHPHRPNANLYCLKKKVYSGIIIFNSLLPGVTILKNYREKFKATLQNT